MLIMENKVLELHPIFKLDMTFFDMYESDDKKHPFLDGFYVFLKANNMVNSRILDFIYLSPITFLKKLPCPVKYCLLYDNLDVAVKEATNEYDLHVSFSHSDPLNRPGLECRLYNNPDEYKAVAWMLPYTDYTKVGISIVPKEIDTAEMFFKDIEKYSDLRKYRKSDLNV